MDHADNLFDEGILDRPGGIKSGPAIAQHLDPPAVDPRRLALTNRLSQRRPPVAITLGNAVLAFTPVGLGSLDASAPPAQRMLFWLTIDGRPLVLQMAKKLYECILARIDPELLAADVDQDMLPLLLESCIEDSLVAAETGLQGRVELVAVQPGAAFDLDGLDVALEVSIDGEKTGHATFRTGQDDVERLADKFAARSMPVRSYGDLKVELRLRACAIWLDLRALKRLKTGDILLAEGDASHWDRMAATAGESWFFPVEMQQAGPTVQAPFRRADLKDQEEWMMVEPSQANDDEQALKGLMKSKQEPGRASPLGQAEPGSDQGTVNAEGGSEDLGIDSGPAAPPADAAFDDLPIKLVFELGRMELPLGQLQEIGAGHVFQLERPIGEAVEIHAGNRRIGQGEVVRIEDQIGVRIVRLFGQSRV